MKMVYSNQIIPNDFSNSIFLAGPTPRAKVFQKIRKKIDILKCNVINI